MGWTFGHTCSLSLFIGVMAILLKRAKLFKTLFMTLCREPIRLSEELRRHEISNNMACATSKASDQPAHTLEYSMSVKLLTEHHLEFLSLKGSCTGSSESTLVKMPHCWNSRVTVN